MDFQQGFLTAPEKKRKLFRKELGKVIKATTFRCRRMAAVLGQVRSVLPALRRMKAYKLSIYKKCTGGTVSTSCHAN